MKIISDTSSLLSPKEGREQGVMIVPAVVIVNGKDYRDLEEINSEQLLTFIKEGAVPTSSQPSIGDILDIYEKDNEEILHLSIGDGLSGSYQNAMGAKNCTERNAHIHVIDTKTLAGALQYLIQKANHLKMQGFDISFIKKELLKSVETSVSFVIPFDFKFLKRCGRLTPVAAELSNLIKIVPVLTQTEDKRRITIFSVKRSYKKALTAIIDHLKKKGINEDYFISICHGGAAETAAEVLQTMETIFTDATIKVFELSPALILHGGPGSIVIQAIKK